MSQNSLFSEFSFTSGHRSAGSSLSSDPARAPTSPFNHIPPGLNTICCTHHNFNCDCGCNTNISTTHSRARLPTLHTLAMLNYARPHFPAAPSGSGWKSFDARCAPPVHSLPVELLSYIFLLCTHTATNSSSSVVTTNDGNTQKSPPFTTDSIRTPVLLSTVDWRWRKVALNTPALWTNICITSEMTTPPTTHSDDGEGVREIDTRHLTTFTKLSRGYPLNILIDARDQDWDFSESEVTLEDEFSCYSPLFTSAHMHTIISLLLPSIHRWRSLDVLTDTWKPMHLALQLINPVITTQGAPKLESLTLMRCNDFVSFAEEFQPASMKEPFFLQLPVSTSTPFSPGSSPFVSQLQSQTSVTPASTCDPSIILPRLRNLNLRGVHLHWSSLAQILASRPCVCGLKSLELSSHCMDARPSLEDFTTILQASAGGLSNLTILGSGIRRSEGVGMGDDGYLDDGEEQQAYNQTAGNVSLLPTSGPLTPTTAPVPGVSTPIVLPHLKSLHFGYRSARSAHHLLSLLDAPNVERLVLEDASHPSDPEEIDSGRVLKLIGSGARERKQMGDLESNERADEDLNMDSAREEWQWEWDEAEGDGTGVFDSGLIEYQPAVADVPSSHLPLAPGFRTTNYGRERAGSTLSTVSTDSMDSVSSSFSAITQLSNSTPATTPPATPPSSFTSLPPLVIPSFSQSLEQQHASHSLTSSPSSSSSSPTTPHPYSHPAQDQQQISAHSATEPPSKPLFPSLVSLTLKNVKACPSPFFILLKGLSTSLESLKLAGNTEFHGTKHIMQPLKVLLSSTPFSCQGGDREEDWEATCATPTAETPYPLHFTSPWERLAPPYLCPRLKEVAIRGVDSIAMLDSVALIQGLARRAKLAASTEASVTTVPSSSPMPPPLPNLTEVTVYIEGGDSQLPPVSYCAVDVDVTSNERVKVGLRIVNEDAWDEDEDEYDESEDELEQEDECDEDESCGYMTPPPPLSSASSTSSNSSLTTTSYHPTPIASPTSAGGISMEILRVGNKRRALDAASPSPFARAQAQIPLVEIIEEDPFREGGAFNDALFDAYYGERYFALH